MLRSKLKLACKVLKLASKLLIMSFLLLLELTVLLNPWLYPKARPVERCALGLKECVLISEP